MKFAHNKQFRKKLLDDQCLKTNLCEQSVQLHENVARSMSAHNLANAACRMAAAKVQCVVYCALEKLLYS